MLAKFIALLCLSDVLHDCHKCDCKYLRGDLTAVESLCLTRTAERLIDTAPPFSCSHQSTRHRQCVISITDYWT
ncbi:hypothetical protein BDV96DRAFT_85422 [Lophiotrema nucula]|uniref:Secreted protein n=1 Tax=Lophiotrema nucula TaxID=690887 RepID=A0A6A5Z8T6_9PLEO|nr:hypothetical protein BDV96DRAFT_85422 [Lophiotrema nucula]